MDKNDRNMNGASVKGIYFCKATKGWPKTELAILIINLNLKYS